MSSLAVSKLVTVIDALPKRIRSECDPKLALHLLRIMIAMGHGEDVKKGPGQEIYAQHLASPMAEPDKGLVPKQKPSTILSIQKNPAFTIMY